MNNLTHNILKWLASLGKNKSKGAPVVHQRDNYSKVSLMHTHPVLFSEASHNHTRLLSHTKHIHIAVCS